MKIATPPPLWEEGIDIKYTCTGEDIIEGQRSPAPEVRHMES